MNPSNATVDHSRQVLLLQTFAACGYNCLALDLPSMGRTGGQAVEEARRPQFLCAFIDAVGLRDVVLVGSSMAGQYVVPLLLDRPRGFFIVSVVSPMGRVF